MSTLKLDKNIRKERIKRDWTQKELAVKSGVPYRTLIKIELGTSKEPTIQTVYKIAKALNMSVDQLLSK